MGESISSRRKASKFLLSLDVSDKNWDDLPGQIEDAIVFLERYSIELRRLFVTVPDAKGYLDFPINSRMGSEVASQCDHFPVRLIQLAGAVGLGIELTQY